MSNARDIADSNLDSLTVDTDTLVVDSTNNRVGIGTASPVSPLEIETTNKLGATFTGTTNGEGLTVTQTNYTAGNYISLVEAAYDDSGDVNPNVRIGAMFDGNGSNLAFGTSNSYGSGITNTAMFIDNAGNVTLGAGGTYRLDINAPTSSAAKITCDNTSMEIGTFDNHVVKFLQNNTERMRILSGGGITFNGDTAAANALDDYEEGTWSPTYIASTTNPTISYAIQKGHYVKIGRQVIANCELRTNSVSGGSGNIYVGNLPFTPSAPTGTTRSGTAHVGYSSGWGGIHPTTAYLNGALNAAVLTRADSTSAQAGWGLSVDVSQMATGTAKNFLMLSIIYIS